MSSVEHTERAHLTGFQPAADAVEVECMIAHTCNSVNQFFSTRNIYNINKSLQNLETKK